MTSDNKVLACQRGVSGHNEFYYMTGELLMHRVDEKGDDTGENYGTFEYEEVDDMPFYCRNCGEKAVWVLRSERKNGQRRSQ